MATFLMLSWIVVWYALKRRFFGLSIWASELTQWMIETHITWIESMTFNLLQFFSSPQSMRVIVLHIYYKSYYNFFDWFRKYCQIAVVVVVEEKINNKSVLYVMRKMCVSAFEVKCPHVWVMHSHAQMFCFFVEFFSVALCRLLLGDLSSSFGCDDFARKTQYIHISLCLIPFV